MLCGWEGNCRSGVTLAMHHRLSGIATYRLNGLGKGDEYLALVEFKPPRGMKTILNFVVHFMIKSRSSSSSQVQLSPRPIVLFC